MIRATFLLAALAAAAPAAAQTFQSTSLLDKAVAGFTGHPIGDDGGARTAVDTRLKLAACPMVTLNWRTPVHDSVVVACPDPDWRIFVPIRIAAPPVVPATALAASEASIAVPEAKPVIVIKRGDPVSVVAGDAGFSITRDGIAMSDAAAGARVLIRVEANKPPIQAIAVESGKAVIPGGE
ncbi:flagella basal body P-ring formation protein FlgA [Sphingomonas sp.]|jgi:flagella basal body P-ring formation protein FlgA|uniref:flagella basal body P-ring formation protein FlgA n=1 Tax=Sphingomonas sp. TaxID=28214 RepID=UPI002E35983E|nr:flagella basal body P-ring formation protein FlgA [Sphingomonas sp.]HEX4694582.1 flagella basal body P-ring formation protein FlgA [Sphingomonas sp.]